VLLGEHDLFLLEEPLELGLGQASAYARTEAGAEALVGTDTVELADKFRQLCVFWIGFLDMFEF